MMRRRQRIGVRPGPLKAIGDAAGDLGAARIGRHEVEHDRSMRETAGDGQRPQRDLLAGVVAGDAGAEDPAAVGWRPP